MDLVFRQGDIGVNWYAILEGTLDVNVSHTGHMEVKNLKDVTATITCHVVFKMS